MASSHATHSGTWAPVWGATCTGYRGEKRIVNRGSHSPISTHLVPSFNPRGTMFPHDFVFFAGDVAAWRASDRIIAAEIAWSRVHAIINQARGYMHF